MKITDHIGIFEKGLPLNVCEAVIQSFNLWEGQREFIAEAFKDGENQFKDGNFSRSDTQLCLEVVDLDLYKTLNGFVKKAFEQYTSVYSGILQNNDPVSTWTTKVQKTKAGGGYHQWHCENGQFLYRDKFCMDGLFEYCSLSKWWRYRFLTSKINLQPGGTIVLASIIYSCS